MDLFSAVSVVTTPIVNLLTDRYLIHGDRERDIRDRAKIDDYIKDARIGRRVQRHLELIADEIAESIELSIGSFESTQNIWGVERVCDKIKIFFESHCDLKSLYDASFDENIFYNRRVQPFIEEHCQSLSERESTILQSSFREAVHVLMRSTIEMDRFDADRSEWSIRKLNQIAQSLSEINRTTSALLEAAANASETSSLATEARYRTALARSIDNLELLGIDAPAHLKKVPLQSGFCSLTLSGATFDDEATYPPIEEVLDSCITAPPGKKIALIRGEAGSGKSTICKWLCLQLCAQKRIKTTLSGGVELPVRTLEAKEEWLGLVPFLIPLRHWTGTFSIRELLSMTPDIEEDQNWVNSVFEEGRAVFIFDGIDEIDPSKRDSIANWILAFNDKYPESVFLITTRPSATPKPWKTLMPSFDLMVNPLNESQRQSLLTLWFFAAKQAAFSVGLDWEYLNTIEADFASELTRSKPLRKLANSPFLASAMCAIAAQRNGIVPPDARNVCDALIDALIHRRDKEKRISVDQEGGYFSLSLTQKRVVFQELALEMLVKGNSSMSLSEATVHLIAGADLVKPSSVNPMFVEELMERSGLLREIRPGEIEFTHNTMKELLACDALISKGMQKQIVDNLENPDWSEVVRFAVSSNQQHISAQIVSALLSFLDQRSTETDRSLAYLALTAGLSAPSLTREAWLKLSDLALGMLPPSNFEEAEAVAFAGPSIVQQLAYDPSRPEPDAAACVRTLNLLNDESAEIELLNYAKDHRSAVRKELIEAINPLYIPEYTEGVLTRSGIDLEIARRIVDLQPLGTLQKSITVLNLRGASISSLGEISHLVALKWLNISQTRIVDISGLSECRELEYLNIDYSSVGDLSGLRGLEKLGEIHARGVSEAEKFSPLKGQKFYVDYV